MTQPAFQILAPASLVQRDLPAFLVHAFVVEYHVVQMQTYAMLGFANVEVWEQHVPQRVYSQHATTLQGL